MGCGHSKINIYPKKSRNKSNSKKAASLEKESEEEEDGVAAEVENKASLEDSDEKKSIKPKPFGGPLSAQIEISTSQQDFFKMLDEKIASGPDYNSESDSERAFEAARLNSLLRDWKTACHSTRSSQSTPRHRSSEKLMSDGVRCTEYNRDGYIPPNRGYISQIPQNVLQQSYTTIPATPPYYKQSQQQLSCYTTTAGTYYTHYPPPPPPPPVVHYQIINPLYQPPPPPSHQQPIRPHYVYKSYLNTQSPKHQQLPYDGYSPPRQQKSYAGNPLKYGNGAGEYYAHYNNPQQRELLLHGNRLQRDYEQNEMLQKQYELT